MNLAPVVQRVDSFIQRIKYTGWSTFYPLRESLSGITILIYPLDNVLPLFQQPGLVATQERAAQTLRDRVAKTRWFSLLQAAFYSL